MFTLKESFILTASSQGMFILQESKVQGTPHMDLICSSNLQSTIQVPQEVFSRDVIDTVLQA